MMQRVTTLLLLGLFLLVGSQAQAQAPAASFDFRAVSSSIADGAAGVPDRVTLTFTLNNPLPDDDVLMQLGWEGLEDLLLETSDAGIVSSSINGDRTEVTYELDLAADTDYGVGFWGLRYDFDGDMNPPVDITYVFQPYAINFTTASGTGDATVQGELLVDPDQFPDAQPNFSDALVIVSSVEGGADYLDVVEDTGNLYEIDLLREGTYIVTALKYGVDLVAGIPAVQLAVGFYDANDDGQLDPLMVAGGSAATADIVMNAYFEEVDTARETQPEVPVAALGTSAPNPVRTTATISFQLDAPQAVRIAVYDLLGREVAVLADGPRTPGAHEVVFDAAGLSSGLYLYRMETPTQALTRSLVVAK